MSLNRNLAWAGGLCGALLLTATFVKSQSPSAERWEYASVTGQRYSSPTPQGAYPSGYLGSATVCYATAQGCRNDTVTVVVQNANDNSTAMIAAAAQLGDQGWQMIESNETFEARPKAERITRTFYFRRAKN